MPAPVTGKGGSKNEILLIPLTSFVPVLQKFRNGQFLPGKLTKLLKTKKVSPYSITTSIKLRVLASVTNLWQIT